MTLDFSPTETSKIILHYSPTETSKVTWKYSSTESSDVMVNFFHKVYFPFLLGLTFRGRSNLHLPSYGAICPKRR